MLSVRRADGRGDQVEKFLIHAVGRLLFHGLHDLLILLADNTKRVVFALRKEGMLSPRFRYAPGNVLDEPVPRSRASVPDDQLNLTGSDS